MECGNCGSKNPANAVYCLKCGKRFPPEQLAVGVGLQGESATSAGSAPQLPETASTGKVGMLIRRLSAMVLDTVIIGALFLLSYVLMFEFVFAPVVENPDAIGGDLIASTRNIAAVYVLLCFLPILYFGLFEGSPLKATLGKRFMGVVVLGPSGSRLSAPRSFARATLKFLSLIAFPLLLVGIFTPGSRMIHDFVAGSRVLDSGRPPY